MINLRCAFALISCTGSTSITKHLVSKHFFFCNYYFIMIYNKHNVTNLHTYNGVSLNNKRQTFFSWGTKTHYTTLQNQVINFTHTRIDLTYFLIQKLSHFMWLDAFALYLDKCNIISSSIYIHI